MAIRKIFKFPFDIIKKPKILISRILELKIHVNAIKNKK